jgi:hypothetical protein
MKWLNKYLNQIINIVILFVCVSAALWWGFGQRSEKLRYLDNFNAERKDRDQEREISGKELKKLYGVTEKLQKELGIKPKQVVQWMQGEISFRDTGSTKILYRDKEVKVYPDSLYGSIDKNCYTLNWLLYKGMFTESLDYKDSLQVMIYRERSKRIWFIKYGRWLHSAALYSGCRDSVYKVFDNIKVKGR